MAMVDLRQESIGEVPTLDAPLAPRLTLDLNDDVDTAIERIVAQLNRLQRLVWEKTVLSPELKKRGNEETK